MEPTKPESTTAEPPRALFGIPPAVLQWIPALGSLQNYTARTFGSDLIAGLTVAAVAVPQSIAYAQIAGIPPQYGLYTAVVMTAVGAIFDSSRQLINGPTNAISIAVLSALAGVADADRIGAAILLAFLVGVVQTGITLLRLGDLTRYISHAVIIGFTLGASALLVIDQTKNLIGLPGAGGAHDHFLKRFWLTAAQLPVVGIHWPTLAIGAGSIALVLALRWLNLRFRLLVPEFLLTIIGMAALVGLFQLDQAGVAIVGEIPSKLPSFELPAFQWQLMRELAGSSLAIAILGLLEAVAMAKAIAAQTRQRLDINQQCLSEGLANLSGSFFQCFPGSGSLTRSTVNQQAGAKTQWSGVIAALAVAATIVLFAPYARYVPKASLAGILMVSAYRLIDRKQLSYYLRCTRYDAGIVLMTAISAVAISVESCVLIGVFLSFLLYVPRAARIHLTELTLAPERVLRERVAADPPCGKLAIFDLEGELFFGAAPQLDEYLETIEPPDENGARVVVLRLKSARNTDAVCLELLDRFVQRLEAKRVKVLLCGVRPELGQLLHASGIDARLGPSRIFRETDAAWSSTLDAVRHAYELLGRDTCATCPRRAETPEGKEGWYYMI